MAGELPPSTRIGHFSFVTEGMKQAVEEGWITRVEAKKEIRAMLPLTSRADSLLKRAQELRDQADDFEAAAHDDRDDN
jgi:hypothetical protein